MKFPPAKPQPWALRYGRSAIDEAEAAREVLKKGAVRAAQVKVQQLEHQNPQISAAASTYILDQTLGRAQQTTKLIHESAEKKASEEITERFLGWLERDHPEVHERLLAYLFDRTLPLPPLPAAPEADLEAARLEWLERVTPRLDLPLREEA